MSDSDKRSRTKPKRRVIDLRKATSPDDDTYICEYCDIRLIPYFDINHERITTGKLFQCGRCGIIKDTSYNDLKRPELLQAKGDNMNLFITHVRQTANMGKPKPFDPEPGNDELLKGQGFHVVKTRITVGGKILRND